MLWSYQVYCHVLIQSNYDNGRKIARLIFLKMPLILIDMENYILRTEGHNWFTIMS